jgi:hypothetical protein
MRALLGLLRSCLEARLTAQCSDVLGRINEKVESRTIEASSEIMVGRTSRLPLEEGEAQGEQERRDSSSMFLHGQEHKISKPPRQFFLRQGLAI